MHTGFLHDQLQASAIQMHKGIGTRNFCQLHPPEQTHVALTLLGAQRRSTHAQLHTAMVGIHLRQKNGAHVVEHPIGGLFLRVQHIDGRVAESAGHVQRLWQTEHL